MISIPEILTRRETTIILTISIFIYESVQVNSHIPDEKPINKRRNTKYCNKVIPTKVGIQLS